MSTSQSENKVHVGKEVKALLAKFDLHGPDVGEINITPTKATITVFKRNENGEKYTINSRAAELLPGSDSEDVTGFSVNTIPATETKTYAIRT